MARPRQAERRASRPGLSRPRWLPWLAGAAAVAAAAALLPPPSQQSPSLLPRMPFAAAQQVHVPRRDKAFKALVDARLPTIENPAAAGAASFATAPRGPYPGVASGGGGDPIRGDVGLGAPLDPGDAAWAYFGAGGAPPAFSADVATSEVAEFDPTYAPDGDPVDAEEREREEEEAAEAARAAGRGSEAEEGEEADADAAEREREEDAARSRAGLPPKSPEEKEREREARRRKQPPPGFESFVAKPPSADPSGADAGAPPPLVRGLAIAAGPWSGMPGPAPVAAPDPATLPPGSPGGPPPPPQPPRPAARGIKAAVDGLNCTDNALANRKLTEPPDLTLCSSGRFLLQLVNSAYAIHDAESGARLGGPFSLYDLFGVPKNSSMTDPGCIFDAAGSRRFFLTIQWYTKLQFAYQVFVVSKTEDPRDGFRGVYFVDTAGKQPELGLTNCAELGGCLGDYPSYGMDAAAFWFGVNHYTFATSRLQGASLYGVRKADLLNATGDMYPRVAVFSRWGDASTRLGFTLQPATVQAGTPYDTRRGGTQFVVASSYFFRTNVSSIVAWAVTNTSLIEAGFPGGATPSLSRAVVLPTAPLRKPAKLFRGGLPQAGARGATDQTLDEKDERLQQVIYAGGSLWTNMQTGVNVAPPTDKKKDGGGDGAQPSQEKAEEEEAAEGGGIVSGIAYFRIEPGWEGGTTGADGWAPVLRQNGYIAAASHHCLNGALAAVKGDAAAMALSVMGPSLNYSAAIVGIGPGGPGPILVPRPAPQPLFGFSSPMRNGDYTGATASGDGKTVWLGAQCASGYVHVTATGSKTNWATQLYKVDPWALARGG